MNDINILSQIAEACLVIKPLTMSEQPLLLHRENKTCQWKTKTREDMPWDLKKIPIFPPLYRKNSGPCPSKRGAGQQDMKYYLYFLI